jgi:glycosyltransferase involved in cell wall biosynthesis
MTEPVIVIPAYQPTEGLASLVVELAAHDLRVVVVDDGSTEECSAATFTEVAHATNVILLRHAVNLGKGAALRTGINHALTTWGEAAGVVTADADGQHLAGDILKVAAELRRNPHALILGVRTFTREVPMRSRVGNLITRTLVRTVVGRKMSDTQTGLRGIPRALACDLLRLSASGYEFELDMLVLGKHLSVPVKEVPISTVYLDGNASSHFNPVRDSMKIYFVLFRFALLSLATAVVDNLVFVAAYALLGRVAFAQGIGRVVAIAFNYGTARRAVFLSRAKHSETLPRFLALVVVNGFVSYAVLMYLHTRFGMSVIASKLIAEGLLFCANFALQRDFVFTRKGVDSRGATDWDAYYRSVFPAAVFTRKYTMGKLSQILSKFAGQGRPISIIEFGGANSCFVDSVVRTFPTETYYAADINELGLGMLSRRKDLPQSVVPFHVDVLNPQASLPQAEVVMSVGLIEHFNPAGTRAAIENHFRYCKPGGLVILSYPTPTMLYRLARWLAEAVRAWKFPDERPLGRREVDGVASQHGTLLYDRILWPLVFTQRVMVFRKL